MSRIDFESYRYFPALRTRSAEMRGLAQLEQARKRDIIPLITLGKWPRSDDFARSAAKAVEAMDGGPFFMDLPDDPRHHTEHSASLADPHSNFAAWQSFVLSVAGAIPIVQTARGSRREVAQQARLFEARHGALGFRIRDFQRDTPLVIAALSALDDVNNALVYVDAQYIRSALPAYIAAVTGTINALRSEVPETIVAVLSTSFPASRTAFFDISRERGSIPILEGELYRSIGGPDVALYGDYASIHAVVYDDQPIMRWSPTIDYPLEDAWVFERRGGEGSNSAGYSAAAAALVARFPEISTSPVWGDQMICEAANGDPYGSAPQSWIAVRVNLHLTRQLNLAANFLIEPDDDFEF